MPARTTSAGSAEQEPTHSAAVNPVQVINTQPMRRMQKVAVAITIVLNALDGIDVMSISFAGPGLSAEWGIDRSVLGIVLAMELLGMAAGSILFGGVADRIGRRPMILISLLAMSAGMLLCATAGGVVDLSVYRVLVGLGMGGMLSSINAMAAEYANDPRRDLCVALMGIGYPLGAVLGGVAAVLLLQHGDWRSVFLFGGVAAAILIPVVVLWLPESLHFICKRRQPDALERANAILTRMGHPNAAELPAAQTKPRSGYSDILQSGSVRMMITFAAIYFLHMTTFYFILKWVPKIVVDMGFVESSAAGVLVWANVGGIVGGAIVGLLAQRFGLRRMVVAMLIGSTMAVIFFGRSEADLILMTVIVTLAGFFSTGGLIGMYAIIARAFPTQTRATSTGFVAGVGRGGAVIAPIVAGYLFTNGIGLSSVAALMGAGSAIGAILLLTIRLAPMRPDYQLR
ncbi:hypothetical protein CAF53_26285 [Sphingobium sp. LB126]|uniref:MFS transporter n=1 Tax=Sphingobium sp. LB126 TaxID=1983755 RepID=UPI000C2099CE|nr:MFS transporter [Sphingobium sp. LB126]PJG44986.1 hypothetical protein CAF53_26285 [Sphingobium sp. LB126]